MVVQRLTTGSIRVSQNMMRALAPGGKAFNDLRPPMPQEIAQAGSALFGMFPKGKLLLSTIRYILILFRLNLCNIHYFFMSSAEFMHFLYFMIFA